MASIFLSYARQDRARAGKVASALEDAGHSVWWDRQIHAGSRFSAEIDRALKSSDLVVVLWSRASVDSAWVQDEAAAGRDSSRLVPVLIDPVDPPLGFRQYHAIDLKRGRATAYKALTEAVSDKLGAAEPTKPIAAASSRRVEWPILAIGSLILLALGTALFMTRAGQGKAFTLAVVPASGASATSGDLAHQVALDSTNGGRPERGSALRPLGPGSEET